MTLAAILSSTVIATLGGAMIGSFFGFRAQAFLQRRERWQRDGGRTRQRHDQDAEREHERRAREAREETERIRDAAVRALAIEALLNSALLLIVARHADAMTGAQPGPRIAVERKEFDRHLLLAAQQLKGANLQQAVSTYLDAFTLQRSREAWDAISVASGDLKKMNDLSLGFATIFRTLGQTVFSPAVLREFEMVLKVAEAPGV